MSISSIMSQTLIFKNIEGIKISVFGYRPKLYVNNHNHYAKGLKMMSFIYFGCWNEIGIFEFIYFFNQITLPTIFCVRVYFFLFFLLKSWNKIFDIVYAFRCVIYCVVVYRIWFERFEIPISEWISHNGKS